MQGYCPVFIFLFIYCMQTDLNDACGLNAPLTVFIFCVFKSKVQVKDFHI